MRGALVALICPRDQEPGVDVRSGCPRYWILPVPPQHGAVGGGCCGVRCPSDLWVVRRLAAHRSAEWSWLSPPGRKPMSEPLRTLPLRMKPVERSPSQRGDAVLELRPSCENYNTALPPDSVQARICTFSAPSALFALKRCWETSAPTVVAAFRPVRPARQ